MSGTLSPDQLRFLRHLAVWFPVVGAVVCLLWALAADTRTDWVVAAPLALAVLAIEARLLHGTRAQRPAAAPTQEGTR